MKQKTKIIISVIALLVLGTAASIQASRGRTSGVEVRTEEIELRDLVEVVTASGNIRALRTVDVSSEVSAKVSELLVDEGEDVLRGQIMLRLEPDQYRASVARTEASLAQARAGQTQQEANLLQAERDLNRLLALRARDTVLVSGLQVDDARTRFDVAVATLTSSQHGVSQWQASVDEAMEQLSKTIFRAPMDGKVTRLNVEEGQTVIIGTMNNAGSLVLTISDLSVIEVVVQVDETDVPAISIGDSASIRIDAFGDREFTGHVTEIGNSAINPPSRQAAGQQAAIDFEVVLTLELNDAVLRPDLSATADIVTESRSKVLGVPIIALTVREEEPDTSAADYSEDDELDDIEGVFMVSDGTVTFTAVEIGIAGQEYFEILSGISVGDTVVAGPYQRIRQLRNGDAVRSTDEPVIN
ncbi:MAG: efflux RND transporter periplasmic adaptor subunit [Gemmatimonadetes bacterium]|jgi:HlyD family secretion protein|nr:efflux RND transporter periplasmic adaptor subunit [Gemmatimonadota bacterium]